jgi:hypothetical protein
MSPLIHIVRRQWDSNPRAFYRLWFSRPAHSSTLPYLRAALNDYIKESARRSHKALFCNAPPTDCYGVKSHYRSGSAPLILLVLGQAFLRGDTARSAWPGCSHCVATAHGVTFLSPRPTLIRLHSLKTHLSRVMAKRGVKNLRVGQLCLKIDNLLMFKCISEPGSIARCDEVGLSCTIPL